MQTTTMYSLLTMMSNFTQDNNSINKHVGVVSDMVHEMYMINRPLRGDFIMDQKRFNLVVKKIVEMI